MVAKKSKKTPKLTYTDRVLSAFTQIQKEHKKREVHLATIRAQVRKNAEARNETLGPQWSSFVGKAVLKLEEQGLLQTAHQPGNVALTPSGKKSIITARRSIPHTQSTENVLWRHIAQNSAVDSNSSTQRNQRTPSPAASIVRRRSSVAARQSRISKRPRFSSASMAPTPRNRSRAATQSFGSSKPLRKMTKAELIAAYMKLETQAGGSAVASRVSEATTPLTVVDESGRAMSPLTDLEDDDVDETLTQPDEEMSMPSSPSPLADLALTPRQLPVHEPAPSFLHSPAAAAAQNRPVNPSRLRTGVIRTDSGSLISLVSHQPTPAPSDHGDGPHPDVAFGSQTAETPHPDEDAGNDVHLASIEEKIYNALTEMLIFLRDNGIAPDSDAQDEMPVDLLGPTVKTLMDAFKNLRGQRELAVESATNLSLQIIAKDSVIRTLRERLDQSNAAAKENASQLEALTRNQDALRASLEEKGLEISTLIDEQAEALQALHTKHAAALNTLATDKDQIIMARIAETDAARCAHESSTAALNSKVEGLEALIADLRRISNEKDSAILESASHTQALDKKLQMQDDQLKSQTASAASLLSQHEQLMNDKQDLAAERDRLVEINSGMEKELEALEGIAEQLRLELSNAKETLITKEASLSGAQAELAAAIANTESLQLQDAAKDANIQDLQREIQALSESALSLGKDLDLERVTKKTLEDEVAAARLEVGNLTASRSTLLSQLNEGSALQTNLEQRVRELEDLAQASSRELATARDAELKAMQDVDHLNAKLAADLLDSQAQTEELARTRNQMESLQKHLALLQEAKVSDEGCITRLKSVIADFTRRQHEELVTLATQIETNNASHVDLPLLTTEVV
ncbi:hypothetical protein HGRIS_011237 [Hohenbuehelia grisea]|uniref:Uncharacterized protein n=1 Tax=Hohenbuehelia grisea TaxID=104357 RepID=A0ABR3JUG2_9AGAR